MHPEWIDDLTAVLWQKEITASVKITLIHIWFQFINLVFAGVKNFIRILYPTSLIFYASFSYKILY